MIYNIYHIFKDYLYDMFNYHLNQIKLCKKKKSVCPTFLIKLYKIKQNK